MKLSIFDLDNTLLCGDSDHAWGEFVADKGLVNAQTYRARNDQFYQAYLEGCLDIIAYQEFVLEPLTQLPWDTLEQLRQEFVHIKIKPLFGSKARELLAEHREQGRIILIITATNSFITKPIAELMQVNALIATEPEIVDQRITGRLTGTPSFQGGKIIRLYEWLEKEAPRYGTPDLKETFFYSDSFNDIPLLEHVGNPVAVDPDPKLEHYAKQQGWPVVSLRPV